jgi:hypothetical protein
LEDPDRVLNLNSEKEIVMSRELVQTTPAKKPTRRRFKGRLIASMAALTTAAIVSLGAAAPAQAATPAFEIFFGSDCGGGGTASRTYTGVNSGESWINDTFNSSQFGSAGYGQTIRNNAASMYVSAARVLVQDNTGVYHSFSTSGGFCFNFDSTLRNKNVWWSTRAIVP